jgi:hypothetical protein
MNRVILSLATLGALAAMPSRADASFIVQGTLTGDQATPPNGLGGRATFVGVLNDSGPGLSLSFTVTFDADHDLFGSFISASFQDVAPAYGGADVRTFTDDLDFQFGPTTFSGTWKSTDAQPLTAAFVSDLRTGRIYFNVATSEFDSEVRGPLAAVPGPAGLGLGLVGAAVLGLAGLRRRAGLRAGGEPTTAAS